MIKKTKSRTKTSFYRRLYIAFLIEKGINTIPKIMEHIAIPRRTAQDTILALNEIEIECQFDGANKNGQYKIISWGAIDPIWISKNIEKIKEYLQYQ